jgi:hypothetical protein
MRDHIDHVRTQLPYAPAVGLVGRFAGTLLVAYLYPWRVGMLISLAILVVVLFGVGRPIEQAGSVQVRPAAAGWSRARALSGPPDRRLGTGGCGTRIGVVAFGEWRRGRSRCRTRSC